MSPGSGCFIVVIPECLFVISPQLIHLFIIENLSTKVCLM
jgi:hypothetical protein